MTPVVKMTPVLPVTISKGSWGYTPAFWDFFGQVNFWHQGPYSCVRPAEDETETDTAAAAW